MYNKPSRTADKGCTPTRYTIQALGLISIHVVKTSLILIFIILLNGIISSFNARGHMGDLGVDGRILRTVSVDELL